MPAVPGHEVFGTVVDLGRDVTSLRLGDRVAVDPNLPCGTCRFCHAGRGNLCAQLGALGVTTSGRRGGAVPPTRGSGADLATDVYRREIVITGSMALLHSFRRAADVLAAGFVDPGVLITHRSPLADYAKSLGAFRDGRGLKMLVLPGV